MGSRVAQRTTLGGVIQHIRRAQGDSGRGRPAKSYSAVAAVYSCVRSKAEAMGMMPLTLSTADDQIVESGPLVELAERPNPGMTGRQFWRATSSHLDLFGRVHWWLKTDSAGRPVELHVINPLQMQAMTDRRTGELIAWKYRAAGAMQGQDTHLDPEDVHTIIDPDFEDPHNPFEGLSPRKAVAGAIAQAWKADIANESSLDNGVEPGGVMETDQMLTDDQRDNMREQINERHAGIQNRRRYMILEGGLEWKTTGASFKDMEFTELKKLTRSDICSAFQVPPSVAGYYENDNRAHAQAAQEGFWTNTILPRAAWLAEEWTIGVASRFDRDRSLRTHSAKSVGADIRQRATHGLIEATRAARKLGRRFFAWFDSSGIPAVQKAKLEFTEQAQKLNQMGVPLADIFNAFDMPFPVRDWQRTWYKPIGLVDVTEDSLSGGPGSDDPSGADETGLLPEGESGPQSGRAASGASGGGDASTRASEATRARLHSQWRASWAGLEQAFRSRTRRHFFELRQQVLDNLKQAMPKAKSITKRELIDLMMFDVAEAQQGLVVRLAGFYRDAYRLGGSQSMEEAAEAAGNARRDDQRRDAQGARVHRH